MQVCRSKVLHAHNQPVFAGGLRTHPQPAHPPTRKQRQQARAQLLYQCQARALHPLRQPQQRIRQRSRAAPRDGHIRPAPCKRRRRSAGLPRHRTAAAAGGQHGGRAGPRAARCGWLAAVQQRTGDGEVGELVELDQQVDNLQSGLAGLDSMIAL